MPNLGRHLASGPRQKEAPLAQETGGASIVFRRNRHAERNPVLFGLLADFAQQPGSEAVTLEARVDHEVFEDRDSRRLVTPCQVARRFVIGFEDANVVLPLESDDVAIGFWGGEVLRHACRGASCGHVVFDRDESR